MQEFNTRELIDLLQARLRRQLDRCQQLRTMPVDVLHQRPSPDRWSVMEVFQHLNLSSGHYHRILQQLYADENNDLRFRTTFRSGRLGDFSARAMEPRPDGNINWRMRTIRRFTPSADTLIGWKALDTFEDIAHGFVGLLERARTRGLEGEKVTSTIGPILRLRTGDAFRFPIAHQERHFLQIERTLEQVRAKTREGSVTV